MEYCLSYADRAHQSGFPALVILGGDKAVGTPRLVEHAWQLRQLLRERDHTLTLGGWANPHADPARQVEFLTADAEFYLTQVVSHHHVDQVARFVRTAERRGLAIPGLFGVFYYRIANARTLEALSGFSAATEGPRRYPGQSWSHDMMQGVLKGLGVLRVLMVLVVLAGLKPGATTVLVQAQQQTPLQRLEASIDRKSVV